MTTPDPHADPNTNTNANHTGNHIANARDPLAEARQGERKHIFVVNHDPDFLDMVRVLFQEDRYNVTTTNYVPRTWDQIAALQPDLLIDLSPYNQAGWELLERLHVEGVTQRIPIVVTSTTRALLDQVQAAPERYGGDAVITKPFDVDDLLHTIHELIGSA